MKNPFRRKRPESKSYPSGFQIRPMDGQGPYTPHFKKFVPRKVEAEFYEFLREALPIIDAAIRRLVSLDGHLTVVGKNEALVEEIKTWMDNIQVNDIQQGFQAFHNTLANEAFEQGFGLGEFIVSPDRTGIVGLRVADSKTIKFQRSEAEGISIFQKVTGDRDWRPLNRSNLVYFSIDNENQNPYGTPLFRSCEFVAKIMATMQNSLLNVWERFGDPSYSIVYKTSSRDGRDHEARREKIYEEFNTAVRAKREGKSADFVRAIDQNSDLEISIIGADNQVLEFEVPSRHVLEQIVAKSGLPPWMLGLHWSTTERLSGSEAEMLLADISTRQAALTPAFTRIIQTHLLLSGQTWEPGDWQLEWEQINLHDVVAQAQARFLNAQADMYYLENASKAGIEINYEDLAIGKGRGPVVMTKECAGHHEVKRPTPWPEMDRVEKSYEDQLKTDWAELLYTVKTILGLESPKIKADLTPDTFSWSPEDRAKIMRAVGEMIGEYSPDDPNSPLKWYYGQAYSLGVTQAATFVGADRPILDIVKNSEIYADLVGKGFDLVRDTATRAISKQILPAMEAHVLAGSNPRTVAAVLERLFGAANSDWERLARTEMAIASETAKVDEWSHRGIDTSDAIIPGRDTHPRCRCSNSIEPVGNKWRIVFTPAPDACPMCQAMAT